MQENKEKADHTAGNDKQTEMAQNPNPRANENIKNTSFEKSDTADSTRDVGSEITDGEGG